MSERTNLLAKIIINDLKPKLDKEDLSLSIFPPSVISLCVLKEQEKKQWSRHQTREVIDFMIYVIKKYKGIS